MKNPSTKLFISLLLLTIVLPLWLKAQRLPDVADATRAGQAVAGAAQIQIAPPAMVNFTERANYELAHPPANERRVIEQGDAKLKPMRQISDGAIKLSTPPAPKTKGAQLQSVAPSPTVSFNGLQDNYTVIPPDASGAAGPTYVMETTNQRFVIYTKSGVLKSTLSMAGLFQSTGGRGFFAPHILYDPAAGQFVVCAAGRLANNNYGIFIAVSQSNDPTGGWYVSSIDGTGNSSDFLDYPEVGYNANWVVVTANIFPSAGMVFAKIFVLNRANLYSGITPLATSFIDPASFSLYPAQTIDAGQTTEFIVQNLDGNDGGYGYMNIGTITGDVNHPQYTRGNSLGIDKPWSEFPVNAPQSGGNPIDDGDTRIGCNVTYVNGSLWFAHTVFLPASAPTYAAVDWWQIDPVYPFAIQQYNRIEDPTGYNFYFYPSINVNSDGDALIGYCTSSPASFASAAYSYHAGKDAPNSMQTTNIYKQGLANYNKTYGTSRNRWGDYTGTAVDYTDNSFWNFSEVALTGNFWGTVIANVAPSMAPTCITPFNLSTTNITSTYAKFKWSASANSVSFTIRYRIIGSLTWTTATSIVPNYSVSGLTPGMGYEWQVESACNGGDTYFSASSPFCTPGPAPTVAVTQPSCSNPTAIIRVTAPVGPGITYSLDGVTYNNTSGVFTNLSPGVYSITAKSGTCISPPASNIIITQIPAPMVSVINNCNQTSTLSTSATGNLLWSTGSTASSITVSLAGIYTVSTTNLGCSSPPGYATAEPRSIPSVPAVSVINNCGNSVVSTTSSGSLLWSTGATSSSITVTSAGTYTLTQTINGCTSTAGSGITAPKSIPPTPVVVATNNCTNGTTVLSTQVAGTRLWSTGSTTSAIIISAPGTYSVTQTINGCASLPGSTQAIPTLTPATPVLAVINNCGNSALSTHAEGNLFWSTGATASSITVTSSGKYTVTTTVNGCTSPAGSISAAPVATPAMPVVVVVNNCTNGTTIMTTSATGKLHWSTGSSTSSAAVNSPGLYTVTQTVSGCISPAGSGTANPGITPDTPVVKVTNNCGSATLSTNSKNLLWSNGATTSSIMVTNQGKYTVTSADGGCVSVAGIGIAAPNSTPSAPEIHVSDNCGSSDLSASVSGALLWSTGETTSSITVTKAGTYSVTQTANGCTSPARSASASPLIIPKAPSVTVSNNCGNSVLSTNATGNLLWSDGTTKSSATVTAAGTYTVTQTVNHCTSPAGSATAAPIAIPDAPVVSVINDCSTGKTTLSTTATGSLLWSDGANHTSITVSVAGTYTVTQKINNCSSPAGSGTANPSKTPVTPVVTVVNNCSQTSVLSTTASGKLSWSNGSTNSSILVTAAGNYTVTSTTNGCTSVAGTGTAAPKPTPATPVITVVNNCGSSLLSTTATGALLWNTGATTSSITVSNSANYKVTQTVNGCTSASGLAASAPNNVPPSPEIHVSDNCGSSDLSANASGSLLWSTGETTSSITMTKAGTYSVTQTVSGCTSPARSTTASPVTIPKAPTVNVSNNCGNSVLSTNAAGNLLWSDGTTRSSTTVTAAGTYTITQTVNQCTSPAGSATAAPMPVPAIPVVSVTNDCSTGKTTLSTTATGTLLWNDGSNHTSITVTAAGTYTVTQKINNCTSPAGSGTAVPTSTPAIPVVTVVNNCDLTSVLSTTASGNLLWNNGATTSTITVSAGGIYSVTSTKNGCTSVAGTGTAALKSNPAAPVITVVNNCGSSLLTTAATGALLWNTGATTSSITVSNSANYKVTQTVNGCTSASGLAASSPNNIPSAPVISVSNNCGSSVLTTNASGSLLWSTGNTGYYILVGTPGTYSVTQTVNGCTSPARSATASPLIIPAAPAVSVSNNCGTSVLSTTATGNLLWSDGTNKSSTTVTSGTYTVTQTINQCTSPAGSATAAPKSIPAIPMITVENHCGSSFLSTTAGGNIMWSTGDTSHTVAVVSTGVYTATQTVNGCTSPAGSGTAAPRGNSATSISISACDSYSWNGNIYTTSGDVVYHTINAIGCDSSSTLHLSINITPTIIPIASAAIQANCQGVIIVTAPTGNGMTYTLVNGSHTKTNSTGSFPNLTPDNYTITANSGGQCSSPDTVLTISAIPIPVVTVVDNCNNTSTLSTTGNGTFQWSQGSTTKSINVSSPGIYSVTRTDNVGCKSAAGSGTADPQTAPDVPVLSVMNYCGNSVLSTTATGVLLWNNGATTSSITVTASGNYSVTQTGTNGCTSAPGKSSATPISIPAAPVVTVVNNCSNATTVLSTNAGASLLWSTGETASSITVSTPGIYTVTKTANGCTGSAGSGTASPGITPQTPVVTVSNNCGNSVLSVTSGGSLLWSNAATTSSVTLTKSGTYSVTSTVNGCSSMAGSGTCAPKTVPAVPAVTVSNNCATGTSVLSTTATGAKLWSTGGTTSAVTVTSAGIYTVAQTVNGCTSDAGSGTANPGTTQTTPVVTVTNNCGNSVLSTTSTGNLLWSNAATTSSITVTSSGNYSVTSAIGACTSAAGSGTAAPKAVPATPTVTVTNNCTNSTTVLSTSATNAKLWSTGATTSSITVSTQGIYTVTVTGTSGCASNAGSGTANPGITPITPVITVTNNCGNSILSTTASGNLLWNNASTTSSVTVTSPGNYSVTSTTNGCISPAASGTAAPKSLPATPAVTVVNNCDGTSLLSTTATGVKLWSNGATTSSITVTTEGIYTITQAANGCTSAAGSGNASPRTTPATPSITITNNCGSTLLAATITDACLWSTGATTSSVTVTKAGSYTITQTRTGCTSSAATGIAAPLIIPQAPTVKITNNCGNSIISTTATGTLLWNTGDIINTIVSTTASTFTVTQQINGCTSSPGSGNANPKIIPSAPLVQVSNNCNKSALTAIANGKILWNTGDTASTINEPAGIYTVTQTVGGCISPQGSGIAEPNIKPGTPDLVTGNTLVCANTGPFPYTVSATPLATSYSWTLPHGATADSLVTKGLTIRVTFGATSSSGNISAKAVNSCGSSINAALLAVTLNANSNSSSNTVMVSCNSYTWNGNMYTNSGSYVYHTINAGGCDSAATLVLTINMNCRTAPAPEAEIQGMSIIASPVPANDKLTLRLNSPAACSLKVKMVDRTGRSVFSNEKQVEKGTNIIDIDVSTFSEGIYMIWAEDGTGSKQLKIVVNH